MKNGSEVEEFSNKQMEALGLMQRLLELMQTKKNRILRSMVLRFLERPEVIIPDLAVSITRAENFAYEDIRWKFDDGRLKLMVLDKEYDLGVGERLASYFNKFMGIIDGLPVWHIYHESAEMTWQGIDSHGTHPWKLMHGDKLVFQTEDVTAYSLLSDGSVVICRAICNNKEGHKFQIIKIRLKDPDPEILAEGAFKFINEIPERIREAGNTLWVCNSSSSMGVWRRIDSIGSDDYVIEAIEPVDLDGRELFIRREGDDEVCLCRIYKFGSDWYKEKIRIIGHVPYDRGYQLLPDGREIYIGKGRNGYCLVVNGASQPTMDWVNIPFLHPVHGYCYMARDGKFTILMKVPEK